MGNRRRETWTFQPDDDVVLLVKQLFGDTPSRGQRTQLINEAIRFTHPETVLIMAEREAAEANERLIRIRKIVNAVTDRASRDLPNRPPAYAQNDHPLSENEVNPEQREILQRSIEVQKSTPETQPMENEARRVQAKHPKGSHSP